MDNTQLITQSIPSAFYGRDGLLNEIVRGVLGPELLSYSLVGARLIGKSLLLKQLAAEQGRLRNSESSIVIYLDCAWVAAICDLLELAYVELVQQIPAAKLEVAKHENGAQPKPAQRVWQLANQLNQQGHRVVLLLDNFATCFTPSGDSRSELASLVNPLRLLMTEASLIVTTAQPLYDMGGVLGESPLLDLFTQRFLGLLEPDAAAAWLAAYQQQFPGLQNLLNMLGELTGRHPFLLRKLGDSLSEIQQMLPQGQRIGPEQAILLRLRLAEHGRPLFMALWHTLQNPPSYIDPATATALLEQLLLAPLSVKQVAPMQFSPLNWLINQAIVIYRERNSGPTYQLFSPLFAEFLDQRLATSPDKTMAYSLPSHVPDAAAPIYEQLTKMEANLLRYFLNHSQSVVSTEQLLTDVWKRADASDRRVQEAIRRLRLQLERQTPAIGIIENERGRGYRFMPATRLNYE